jgi:hypothetical protein
VLLASDLVRALAELGALGARRKAFPLAGLWRCIPK